VLPLLLFVSELLLSGVEVLSGVELLLCVFELLVELLELLDPEFLKISLMSLPVLLLRLSAGLSYSLDLVVGAFGL
jgi:riboflavin transporter FmnP